MPQKIINFIKANAVMFIALILAIISAFFVPPDSEYLDYFDFRTLTCLFCTLAVVMALRNIKFFTMIAQKIVSLCKNLRRTVIALVFITYIGSMLLANDMALLTFLPLGYIVLNSTNNRQQMAFTFIMQNIAANLGGMLTPFGNPQNLYLFSHFELKSGEFMWTMFPPFALASIMIFVCCFVFIKPVPIELFDKTEIKRQPIKEIIYLVLFAISISVVFRIVPYLIGLIVVFVALLIMDRKALLKVDYPLLLTFVCFFIFSGNMSRIEAVHTFFSSLLNINTLVFSTLSCQFISNVPSAVLLSRFTDNWQQLLVGVNIGGTGTLIASLASLITFRQYTKEFPKSAGKYILKFSAFNFSFLIILLVFELIIFSL